MKAAFDSFAEPQTNRRKFLVGLVLASAAGIALWRKPRIKRDYLGTEKLADLVPKTIGRWRFLTASGLVVPTDDPFEKMIYAQTLTRVYSDGEHPPVMLLIAQNGGQTGFLQIHRPETCYTASGYQISPVTSHLIDVGGKVIPANRMEATSGGPTEHVIYWTRIGDQIPSNWAKQKLATFEQNLDGIIPDAILLRVSAISDDTAAALSTIDDFVRALIQSIAPDRRSVFIV